jgi:hypothetical protein
MGELDPKIDIEDMIHAEEINLESEKYFFKLFYRFYVLHPEFQSLSVKQPDGGYIVTFQNGRTQKINFL